MFRALLSYLHKIFQSVYAKLSAVLFGFDIALILARGQLDFPVWLFLTLSIGALFVAFFQIYYEQYQLLHPEVDFIFNLEKCVVTNARWFEPTRRFKEYGEFELIVYFDIENKSQSEIEIIFDVDSAQIETCLLIDKTSNDLKMKVGVSNPGKVPDRNKLLIPATRHVNVNLRIYPQMQFHHPENSLRAIGRASRFLVPIKATQTGKGSSTINASISNPKEEFGGLVLREIYNWISQSSQIHGSAGPQEIVYYLLWLFDADFNIDTVQQ